MIQSKFIVCADRAIRDSDRGELSIINILDDIIAESFPIVLNRFYIVTFLAKDNVEDPDRPDVKITMINNEEHMVDFPLKIDFRGKRKTRSVVEISGLTINNPGQVHFAVVRDDTEIDRYSINLVLREPIVVQND